MNWLLIVLIVLVLGKFAEILRAMRTSIPEQLRFLSVAADDVEKLTEQADFDQKSEVLERLATARSVIADCRLRLATATRSEREHIRQQLTLVAGDINAARHITEAALPQEEDH